MTVENREVLNLAGYLVAVLKVRNFIVNRVGLKGLGQIKHPTLILQTAEVAVLKETKVNLQIVECWLLAIAANTTDSLYFR